MFTAGFGTLVLTADSWHLGRCVGKCFAVGLWTYRALVTWHSLLPHIRPAVTVSWLGVCLYALIESSYGQPGKILALVLITILCLSSLSPQLCVYSCSQPVRVNWATRQSLRSVILQKKGVRFTVYRSRCHDAPARGRIAAGQLNCGASLEGLQPPLPLRRCIAYSHSYSSFNTRELTCS